MAEPKGAVGIIGMGRVFSFGLVVAAGVFSVSINAVGWVAIGVNAVGFVAIGLANAIGVFAFCPVNACGAYTRAGVNGGALPLAGPILCAVALGIVFVRHRATRPTFAEPGREIEHAGPAKSRLELRRVAPEDLISAVAGQRDFHMSSG